MLDRYTNPSENEHRFKMSSRHDSSLHNFQARELAAKLVARAGIESVARFNVHSSHEQRPPRAQLGAALTGQTGKRLCKQSTSHSTHAHAHTFTHKERREKKKEERI